MRVVLCEKPSVARDIARFLKANHKHDGYLEGAGWAVTWAFGHLLELKDPHEYFSEWKAWRLDTLPMLPEKFELSPKEDKGAKEQLSVIKRLLKNASEIICATDAGREGELIFRYIQHHAGVQNKPFKRLWVSSLTNEALEKGFQKLLPGEDFDSLFEAARCRSEADWIVGLNATRFFTVSFGEASQLWSLGRVQTPVLAMVVERDAEIERFKSMDFWELHTFFHDLRFKHAQGRFDVHADVETMLEKLRPAPLSIVDVQQKEELLRPPFLYDLTDLQKDLNRRFGMSADRTLKAAQTLYEKKHLSYPRTDSKFLTQDVAKELPALFRKLASRRSEEIAKLDLNHLDLSSRVVNDLKVTDHHAILPTGVLPGALSEDEENVYEAVLTRLIAAFYPSGRRQIVTVKACVLDEPFKATGSVVTDLGWEALYPKAKKSTRGMKKSTDLPLEEEESNFEALLKMKVGLSGEHRPEIKTLKTTPPLPFSEATLLQMMETAGKRVSDEELRLALKDKGLGTPATRASIIETLLSRKYLERHKKTLVSTELGRRLISLVANNRLKSPELTGEWESQLKQIEKGLYDPKKFIQDVATYTREMVSSSGSPSGVAQSLGPCPLCQSEVIEGKRGYGCSKWKEGCSFVLWKEFSGALLSSTAVGQLLRKRRTTLPMKASIDGIPGFAFVLLSDKGTLSLEETKQVPEQVVTESAKALGICPKCGGMVMDGSKAWGCSNWRQGCKFTIWKKIAKKTITPKIAKEILSHGRTEVLSGFKSKAGKEFSASLVVRDVEVKFEF